MPTEADARIVVDRFLREANWDIENKSAVSTEEAAADGRADYLLKNSRTRPLCVVETKRFTIDPYSAKTQSKDYAISLGAPFIILSNGREHYFWDYESGDARPIIGFPTQADLESRANLRQHRQGDLATSIRAVSMPTRFRFKGEEVDARPYQLNCIKTADDSLIAGRRRMLFEMATGTGKTLTIAMLIKRWMQSAAISRVLFLADRIELARQAKQDTFDDYLREYPSTLLYGGKKSLEGQVVVGTLDTIAGQLGPGGFGHAYFDLVITDECHRSIYNSHRATLAHFDAIHIGLTATPNPGELHWVSEHERQLVRSTYMFFDCWDSAAQEGRPTFAYTIRYGIKEKFLADYKIYSAESVLTFDGTDWEDEEIGFSARAARRRSASVRQIAEAPFSFAAVASGSRSGVGVIHARAAGQSLPGETLRQGQTNQALTIVRPDDRYLVPASFGGRAGFAKSTLFAAYAANKVTMEAMNLMVIWTETLRCIVVFIYSLYSMKLVMRRQLRCKLIVGEWPGRRVGKLGREYGLAATFSPQLRHN